MSEAWHFAWLFLSTNVLAGMACAAFLLGHNRALQWPLWPLAIVGLGLGPFLVTLVLFYLLACWHGAPVWLAITLPVLCLLALAIAAGSGWRSLFALLQKGWGLRRDRSLWCFALGSGALFAIAAIFLLNKPVTDHDILEYGIQGRIFLGEMAITYGPHRFDEASGFYYVGLHGFSFPLLFTWEGLMGHLTGVRSDMWVRSITMWYAWLLITLVWWMLRRLDRWSAVAGAIALTAPLGFLFLTFLYHLDSFRIFFFTAAVGAMVLLFRAPGRTRLLLFAFLCGAQAFIHSVGAILGGCMVLVLLLLLPAGWIERWRYTWQAAGVMLLAGCIHYVVDVFLGTGWILQDIIWY
ncbi:MAG: hypothetical protein IPK99_00980 [Flavobacteriales bacterium]|nr:hypothetical protein [Flavobacteriales bacterium]